MYTLHIRESRSSIDVPMVRSLLLFSIIVIIVHRQAHSLAINLASALVLLTALLSSQYLVERRKLPPLLLLTVAAILMAMVTFNWPLALLLVLVGLVNQYAYVAPTVELNDAGIRLKKTFRSTLHGWHELNNVVLKDSLLTIDFKNNTLLQLEIAGAERLNEAAFNAYCASRAVE